MNITDEDIERALFYLRDSAKDYAFWRGRMIATEYLIKIHEANEFLAIDSGTQEYKKSKARASKAYKRAIEEYEEATAKYTEIQALRKAADARISSWQSQVKSKSQGLI